MYTGQVYNKWNVIGHASEAGSKRQAPKIKICSLDSCRVSRNKMYESCRQSLIMITLKISLIGILQHKYPFSKLCFVFHEAVATTAINQTLNQCCGSGSEIRCLFDPWIRDGKKIRIREPDPE
jgi:hypothetical protein